ncbi:CesT family type III secretion system chaperone [Fulvivirgaceae bacterium BMA10]|uniref:CesT family type III secretion system chaperone n=1 Tax=Splendidivirga corallicola TaxID=3051826 RepID=A0ABT8KHE0_9BACT|nr:CesT family type III secretion system chaperone [Fulvivirgaceae bacterium BMA10]
MNNYFQKVKDYVLELNYSITYENDDDGIIVIEHETEGVKNLVLGVADPLLIVEQFILEVNNESTDVYKGLLQKNRDIIHGAFVLDESGKKVIFRNTHELENLDLNEIEATLNSLGLLLSEYSNELIKFSKN